MPELELLVPVGTESEPALALAPPQEAGWTRAAWAQAALAGVLALAAFALLAAAAWRAYLSLPYADVHDWIARVFAAERSRNWLAYLFEPHNNQRIPTARLIEAIDIDGVQEQAPSFLLAGAFAWALGYVALLLLLMKARLQPLIKTALGAAAAVLAANIGLAEDFAFPVFSVYLFVAGPALAAMICLQLHPERGWRSIGFNLALAFAALASLGNAAGLAVWPALFASALVQRRRAPEIAAIALAALLCLGLLESGLGAPGGSIGAPSSGGAHIIKMAIYFAAFGGLPWSRSLHLEAGAMLGLCVWAGAIWALLGLRSRRWGDIDPVVQAGAAMIVFGLITALLAVVGRVDELPAPIVPTRYTPFATVLQLGVLLAMADRLDRLVGALRLYVRLGLFGLAVAMLAIAPHGVRAITRAADRIRAASAVFDSTGQQPDLVIHPRPDIAAAVRAQLRARGLPN